MNAKSAGIQVYIHCFSGGGGDGGCGVGGRWLVGGSGGGWCGW